MTSENTPDPPAAKTCGTTVCCGGRWKLPALLAIVLAAIVAVRMTDNRETQVNSNGVPATESSASPTGKTVSLSIQFADGGERQFGALAWRDGMTVDDLMTTVSRQPGGVSYAMRGTGEMAFLTRIDGIQNQGARGKNWTYTVNGARADRGFAVYPLRPDDHVLWTFAVGE